MTTARLSVRLLVALAIVGVLVAAGAVPVPSRSGPRLFDATTQFVAGALAAAVCVYSARRPGRSAAARRWRLLLGIGMTGWALARLWCVVQDVRDPGRGPAVTIADVGLLALPAFAFLALLSAASRMQRAVP